MEHLPKGCDLITGDLTIRLGHFCPKRDDCDGKGHTALGRTAQALEQNREAFTTGEGGYGIRYFGPDRHGPSHSLFDRACQSFLGFYRHSKIFLHQDQIVPAFKFPPHARHPPRFGISHRFMKFLRDVIFATNTCHKTRDACLSPLVLKRR